MFYYFRSVRIYVAIIAFIYLQLEHVLIVIVTYHSETRAYSNIKNYIKFIVQYFL